MLITKQKKGLKVKMIVAVMAHDFVGQAILVNALLAGVYKIN